MQHVARSHARARHTTGHPAPAARASACDGVDGRGPSVNWCVSCWAFAHMKQPGGLGYKLHSKCSKCPRAKGGTHAEGGDASRRTRRRVEVAAVRLGRVHRAWRGSVVHCHM